MELATALEFARAQRQGVLTTIRRDGRPQMSNIVYAIDDAGTARISVTASRAKTKNLQRDPRAALYVCGDNLCPPDATEALEMRRNAERDSDSGDGLKRARPRVPSPDGCANPLISFHLRRSCRPE